MPLPGLTEQQSQLVLAEGSCFAEACPGAGKTRAIVARFLKRTAEEPRKGIAMLSFTNAAIDEVTTRCGSRPEALAPPHFVGTFDSFINRFISRPLYVRRYGRTPRFTDLWATLGIGSFAISGMERSPRLELDWFEFDQTLRASLHSIPPQHQGSLAPIVARSQKLIEETATNKCRALVRGGTLSCAASRAAAAGSLSKPEHDQLIGTLLASRFAEVIVDEAQDCGPEELMILRLLQKFGVGIVLVADLDQAIYEFRRADPAGVRSFADGLGTVLRLDGNFRSSPAICALNTSLRHGQRPEDAVGEHSALQTPIQLLSFRQRSRVAASLQAIASEHGLSPQEIVCVAHRRSDARMSSGARGTVVHANNPVLGIAWSHSVLVSAASTSKERLKAIHLAERTLRSVVRVTGQEDREIEFEMLDERWLREAALRLALGIDPSGQNRKEYAAQIRQHVQLIDWPAGVVLRANLNHYLTAPTDAAWRTRVNKPGLFRSATVHSVKGQEFPCVVVILPANMLVDRNGHQAVDYWEKDTASEYRRVLYVGASRAQRLLILAVHESLLQRVVSLMERDEVPYALHQEMHGLRRRKPRHRDRP